MESKRKTVGLGGIGVWVIGVALEFSPLQNGLISSSLAVIGVLLVSYSAWPHAVAWWSRFRGGNSVPDRERVAAWRRELLAADDALHTTAYVELRPYLSSEMVHNLESGRYFAATPRGRNIDWKSHSLLQALEGLEDEWGLIPEFGRTRAWRKGTPSLEGLPSTHLNCLALFLENDERSLRKRDPITRVLESDGLIHRIRDLRDGTATYAIEDAIKDDIGRWRSSQAEEVIRRTGPRALAVLELFAAKDLPMIDVEVEETARSLCVPPGPLRLAGDNRFCIRSGCEIAVKTFVATIQTDCVNVIVRNERPNG